MQYKVIIHPEAMGIIVQNCLTTPNNTEWSARTWIKKEKQEDLTTFRMVRVRPEQIGTAGEVNHSLGLSDIEDSTFRMEEDNHLICYLHSHHNMTIPFSGTDAQTLKGIAEQIGEYLSVVVFNDFRKMVARYRVRGESEIDVPVVMESDPFWEQEYPNRCAEFTFTSLSFGHGQLYGKNLNMTRPENLSTDFSDRLIHLKNKRQNGIW